MSSIVVYVIVLAGVAFMWFCMDRAEKAWAQERRELLDRIDAQERRSSGACLGSTDCGIGA